MRRARKVTDDIHVLPAVFPLSGYGAVAVNAYVLTSKEPVLIDTGLRRDRGSFLVALSSVIDPMELKSLWLTHPDQDHVGSLRDLMDMVPHLRLVTTYLGYGALTLSESIPIDRIRLVNPGETLDVGDRTLIAWKPPSYDSPATTGFFDRKSRTLFSSDYFGALLDAPPDDASALSREELRRGQILWATLDAPWLATVDPAKLRQGLDLVRTMAPRRIMSTHLPPAEMNEAMLENLASTPSLARPGRARQDDRRDDQGRGAAGDLTTVDCRGAATGPPML